MSCCLADSETLLSLTALSSPWIAFGCSDAAEAATVIDPPQKFGREWSMQLLLRRFQFNGYEAGLLLSAKSMRLSKDPDGGIHVANQCNRQKQSAFVVRN
jgi:hypothetical protein